MFAPPDSKKQTTPAEWQRASVSARQFARSAARRTGAHERAPGTLANGNVKGAQHASNQQAAPLRDLTDIPVQSPGGERFTPPPLPIQAKLEGGSINDPLEREADCIAEQVMRMSGRGDVIATALPRVSRTSAQAEARANGHAKPAGGEAPAIVHEALRVPGHPLDAATRDIFEPRFGRDFSQVRVHTDAKAAESARALGARAYTLGADIVFAPNVYSPATFAGQRLLAHELVHTAQHTPPGQIQRDTKEYETKGIALDTAEMSKWAAQSYWEQKVFAVLSVTFMSPADSRLKAPEERDAVLSALWSSYQSLRPISKEARRPVTIPARPQATPGTAAQGASGPATSAPATGSAAPALAYLFVFSPPARGKDTRERVKVEFLGEGATAAGIAAPAAKEGVKGQSVSNMSFPASRDPATNDFEAYFRKYPDEKQQIDTYLAGTIPADGQLVTTSSTVQKKLHETTVLIKRGPVVQYIAESKPVSAAPPAGYAKHDIGDLQLESAATGKQPLGKVTLPAAMPADEVLPVKFAVWQYFQSGTRNAEVDAIVPLPGTPTRRIFYTLKFHGTTNDVDVVRIGEEGTAGKVGLANLTVDLARIPDYAAHSSDVKTLSAWLKSRYPAIKPTGADVPAMKAAAEKAIEAAVVGSDWFKNNYGMEELSQSAARTRLISAQHLDEPQAADTKDFVPDERRLIERALEALSDPLLARLKGVPIARQNVLIEARGKGKARTYTPDPKTSGLTSTFTHSVGGKVTSVTQTITFYDNWFLNDQRLFTGGAGAVAPASEETPLHEFGHVIGGQEGIEDAFKAKFTASRARLRTAPITWYAKSKPSTEFFPEAFALFHSDPEWMKANLPDMFAWFEVVSKTGKPPP